MLKTQFLDLAWKALYIHQILENISKNFRFHHGACFSYVSMIQMRGYSDVS